MKLKELLERCNTYTIVKITLYTSKTKLHKQFVARVKDVLEEKLWLDKEIMCISLDLGKDEDDSVTKISIRLCDE